MTENNDRVATTTQPELCHKCKKMYGNIKFNKMCSLCFKETSATIEK